MRIPFLAKWACTAFTVIVVLYWVFQLPLDLDIDERRTIMIEDGNLKFMIWGGPRTPHDDYGPDYCLCPLSLIFAGIAMLSIILWSLDRACRKHASEAKEWLGR